MPSYAPNYTARLRVRYHAALANHSQTWRFPAYGTLGIGLAAAKDAVQAVYDHLAPSMYDDWAILSCSYAIENSDVFLPTSPLTATGLTALPADDPGIKARGMTFVGRTAGGQPAKIFQYGFNDASDIVPETVDFRLNAGENALVDLAIAELNGFIVGIVLCGNDGLAVTWYPYANVKDMDYWVKRVRTGG